MSAKGKLTGQVTRLNNSESNTNPSSRPQTLLGQDLDEREENASSPIKSRLKAHKWKILGAVMVIIIAIILGVVLGKGSKPTPTPTPVPVPVPVNAGVNPYYVDSGSLVKTRYQATGYLGFNDTVLGTSTLDEYIANKSPIKMNPKDIPTGMNNQYSKNVYFEFGQVDFKIHKMKFSDAQKTPYSPPSDLVNTKDPFWQMTLDMVAFKLRQNPFGFELRSTRTEGDTYVHTNSSDFIMSEKYMQLDLQVPSQRIYGFGERNHEFTLGEGTWTMWANGRSNLYDDGSGGQQTSGVHPFALVQTKTKGEYMGIYFRNSNAASPIVTHKNNSEATISYITTGGEIEIIFFLKDSAKNVIKAYQNFIGLPTLAPFWALGWHTTMPAYDYSDSDIQTLVESYTKNNIPLESIGLSTTYLATMEDFTVNITRLPELKNFTTEFLHKNNMKMIVGVPPVLKSFNAQSKYYSQAIQHDSLIKSSINSNQTEGGALTQSILKNKTGVFLDFFDKNASDIWKQGLTDLFSQIPFDGLWFDQNEATGGCNGECPNGIPHKNQSSLFQKNPIDHEILMSEERINNTWYQSWSEQSDNSTYKLPFIPGQENLDFMSISLNATHPSNNMTEYNVHSLFGHLQGKITKEVIMKNLIPDKRTFILSRNTFAGSGANVQSYLGRKNKLWGDMKMSISGVMNFNMFGVPLVGPDTCGYYDTQTDDDEICGRWFQLATFYPLSRMNMEYGSEENEPYMLKQPYKSWAISALQNRLEYIQHIYTCLFEVSISGGTCYDPLLFHFSEDDQVFDPHQTEHSFIVGDALKVTPVLEPIDQATINPTINSYFPNGRWVSMKNYSDIVIVEPINQDLGQWVQIAAPMSLNDTINVHLRPGYMVQINDNSDKSFKTTNDVLKSPIIFVANRDFQGHAKGKLFKNIDGESSLDLITGEYEHYEFHLSANSIKKWILNTKSTTKFGQGISKFIITDAPDLESTDFACMVSTNDTVTQLAFFWNYTENTLTLNNIDPKVQIDTLLLRDIYFGDSNISPLTNLCEKGIHFYYIKDKVVPNLEQNQVEVPLRHIYYPYIQDITLKLQALQVPDLAESHILRISWNYSLQPEGVKIPFEVPKSIVGPNLDPSGMYLKYHIDWVQEGVLVDQPFTINVKNPATGKIIYEISSDMIFEEYMNSFNGKAYTSTTNFRGILGLGEQATKDLFLKDGVYSFWSRDDSNTVSTGTAPGTNMYGIHPFFMGRAMDESWFGVFANVAAAQDWRITNNQTSGEVQIKTIATGGVGDLYFMTGSNPQEVTQLYHGVVGTPVVTPQWALGWHQCKWGYRSVSDLRSVVDLYRIYELPLDVIWSDVDYMDDYKAFTVDPVNFANMTNFVIQLKSKGMHYIPIQEAGIAQRIPSIEQYEPYTDGIEQDVFIKSSSGKEPLTGGVWADDSVFPDWFNEKTGPYWRKWLGKLQDEVQFDGLWLDMNEVANTQCTGACYKSQEAAASVQWKLPYIPSGRNLEFKALSIDGIHKGNVSELDAHSLFGTMETISTHDYFINDLKKRPMIIERSSYAGMGKYGSRWLGDNYSTSEYMGLSVTSIMGSHIAGIPLVGSDICGFNSNTNAELCARWYVVGAFYPFSRNHNSWETLEQEPWNFDQIYDKNTTYLQIIQMAMRTKLHLIRYYYTQMHKVQTEGGAFYKPLFFDFANDPGSYDNQQMNVMLGDALKLGVQSTQTGVNSTDFYFPQGLWCDVFNKKGTEGCINQTVGGNLTQSTFAYEFSLYLRSGKIIPMQDGTMLAKTFKCSTIKDLQLYPVDFHVLPSCSTNSCDASGKYFNDDGETLDPTASNSYTLQFKQNKATQNEFVIHVNTYNQTSKVYINNNDHLGSIEIYNAMAQGYNVSYSGIMTFNDDTTQLLSPATYNASSDRLVYLWEQKTFLLPLVKYITFTKVQ